jgi:hypothetical protein
MEISRWEDVEERLGGGGTVAVVFVRAWQGTAPAQAARDGASLFPFFLFFFSF